MNSAILAQLFGAWCSTIGTGSNRALTTSEILRHANETVVACTEGGDYHNRYVRVPANIDLHNAIGGMSVQQLRSFLRRHVGQEVGGYRLCGTKFMSGWRWWLEGVEAKEAPIAPATFPETSCARPRPSGAGPS